MKDWERHTLGLDEFFDCSIYSSEMPYRKPHPSIFELAVHRMGFEKEDILFVGDNLRADVAGAQGAGLAAAWLNRNKAPLNNGVRPDYEISSLTELLALEPADL